MSGKSLSNRASERHVLHRDVICRGRSVANAWWKSLASLLSLHFEQVGTEPKIRVIAQKLFRTKSQSSELQRELPRKGTLKW